jgi:hypothetical protein
MGLIYGLNCSSSGSIVMVVEVTSNGDTIAATAALEARNVQLILCLGTLTGFTIT